jgi:hypothetical protein
MAASPNFPQTLLVISLVLTSCNSIPPIEEATFTSEPSSTSLPTATPTDPPPTATFTPVPSGPCDNPLIPLVPGNRWEYQVTVGEKKYPFLLELGEQVDDMNIYIQATLTDAKNGWTFNDSIICLDGSIDNFPLYYLIMLLADNIEDPLNTYKQSGHYAASHQDLAGMNWTNAWELKYLVEDYTGIWNPARDLRFNLSPMFPIDVKFVLDNSYDSITVPAGTFPQALVEKSEYLIAGNIYAQGMNSAGDLLIKTTQWIVPYVGVVKAIIDNASVTVSYGQGADVAISSLLELTSFVPGK